jgi:hypothetical protein
MAWVVPPPAARAPTQPAATSVHVPPTLPRGLPARHSRRGVRAPAFLHPGEALIALCFVCLFALKPSNATRARLHRRWRLRVLTRRVASTRQVGGDAPAGPLRTLANPRRNHRTLGNLHWNDWITRRSWNEVPRHVTPRLAMTVSHPPHAKPRPAMTVSHTCRSVAAVNRLTVLKP